jgi:hypothetical protein
MTHPNKAKGYRWEMAVADLLRTAVGPDGAPLWPHVERQRDEGRHEDRGDIAGVPDLTIQCKDASRFAPAEWLDDVEQQQINAGNRHGLVIAKRRGLGPARGYVLTSAEGWLDMVESGWPHGRQHSTDADVVEAILKALKKHRPGLLRA